jgi:hypothetical protein
MNQLLETIYGYLTGHYWIRIGFVGPILKKRTGVT